MDYLEKKILEEAKEKLSRDCWRSKVNERVRQLGHLMRRNKS